VDWKGKGNLFCRYPCKDTQFKKLRTYLKRSVRRNRPALIYPVLHSPQMEQLLWWFLSS
jgi:hypothetical protein